MSGGRYVTAGEIWPGRLTRSIAAQVRGHRKARKWSAQRLSDECATFGLAIPRTTITDLETGRRAHVSIAEFLILVRALEIEPADLLPPGDVVAWQRPAPPDPFPAIRRKVAELSRLIEEPEAGQ